MLHLLATPAQRQQTCRSQSTCCYRAGTWWCECCRNISPASMASRTRGDTSSCVQISTSLALLLKAELERTARWSFSGGSVDLIGWEIDLIWKFTTACIRLASFPGLQSPNAVIEDLGTRLASAFNKASFPARIKCWDFGNGDKKTITTGSGKYGSKVIYESTWYRVVSYRFFQQQYQQLTWRQCHGKPWPGISARLSPPIMWTWTTWKNWWQPTRPTRGTGRDSLSLTHTSTYRTVAKCSWYS